MRTRRLLGSTLCLLTCLGLLAACGNDGPKADPHGLEAENLQSEPSGDPITVTFGLPAGTRWTGDLSLRVAQESVVRSKGRTRPSSGETETLLSVSERALADPAGQREAKIDYRQERSSSPDGPDASQDGTSEIRFRVNERGAAIKDSVTVTGAHVPGTQSMIDSMLLAGLASSTSWIPDRSVRVGEAWDASEVMESGEIKRLLKLDRRQGVSMPAPVQRGRVKVEGVREQGGRQVLDLRIGVLVSADGSLTDGTTTGDMSMGWHLRGTCSVDVQTGLPVAIDLEAKNVVDVRTSGERTEHRMSLTVVGTLGPG